MKRKHIVLSFLLGICLLLFTGVVYADEGEFFGCGTDPEVTEELYSNLVKKKLSELNMQGVLNGGIAPFLWLPGPTAEGNMPSTGNVRILVLPIDFPDKKWSRRYMMDWKKPFSKNMTMGNR